MAGLASRAEAQWLKRDYTLQPGWNAILLDVDPATTDPSASAASLPIQSIWMWNRRFESAQFLSDPADLLPQNPDWLVWFPADSPQYEARTLHRLVPGRPYLVKLGGTQAQTWSVTGTPFHQSPEWLPDSFNVAGFSLDPGAPQSFEQFFTDSPAHKRPDGLYRLLANGRWQKGLLSDTMTVGSAFAFFTQGQSDFAGSLATDLVPGEVLDFGSVTPSVALSITNISSSSSEVVLESLESAAPPQGAEYALAGPVPLSRFEPAEEVGEDPGEWVDYDTGMSTTITLGPGETRSVVLAVRRKEMIASAGENALAYQSLLRLTDGKGQEIFVPVRALPPPTPPISLKNGNVQKQTTSTVLAGLWVGKVMVDQVAEPTNSQDRYTLKPASGNFTFRVLFHVDESGQTRLLSQAILMRKETGPQTGEAVVVTDDDLIANYEGVQLRDDSLVGLRLSSVNFPFFSEPGEPRNVLPQSGGSFEDGDDTTDNTLMFDVVVPFDDPLNPMVHRFNPEHDNLNFLFEPWESGGEGIESFTITRKLTFAFETEDPLAVQRQTGPNPNWLVTEVGGGYLEEMIGPYRTDYDRNLAVPIRIGGTFRLKQILPGVKLADGSTN
jgi:hypothetical protein